MEISIFLAKAWGLYLLISSIIFLLNKKVMKDMIEIAGDKTFLMLTGFMSLIIGLLTVISHNVWEGELWIILVTIFGWLALLKGIVRFMWPECAVKMVEKFKNNTSLMYVSLVIILIVGAYLTYMGFYM